MLALGKTGVQTVGSNCRIGHFIVTKGGDNLLGNNNVTAGGTMLALGKTGVHTVGSDRSVDSLGMVCKGALFKPFKGRTTNRASLACFVTFFGTGGIFGFNSLFGVSESRNNILSGQYLTAILIGTLLAFGKTGFSAGGSNSFKYLRRIVGTAVFPHTVSVSIFAGFIRLSKRTVSILKLCGSQRNLSIAGTLARTLNKLIGNGLSTGLHLNHSTFNAVDVGTAGSGVNVTGRGIHRAADNDLGI